MILGTSKIWSKSGPVDLLTITKLAQKIQENMEPYWKHIIFANLVLKKIKKIRKVVCPRFHVLKNEYIICIIFCEAFW